MVLLQCAMLAPGPFATFNMWFSSKVNNAKSFGKVEQDIYELFCIVLYEKRRARRRLHVCNFWARSKAR